MLQWNTTALLNYDLNNFCKNEKMRLTVVAAYPIFGLMPPSSNRKRLFWNIYQCPYGFSLFATSTLSFLDTPPENVTGHFMSTNNFLVALPDFALPILVHGFGKSCYFHRQSWIGCGNRLKLGDCTKFSGGRLVSDKV